MENKQGAGQATEPVGVLEAKVIRACPVCNAPGVWVQPRNDQEREHYAKWPHLIKDTEIGQPVGDVCPQCGSQRNPVEDKGVIGRFNGALFGFINRYWQ